MPSKSVPEANKSSRSIIDRKTFTALFINLSLKEAQYVSSKPG